MPDRQADFEVYLRGCTVERAVEWARSAVGPLTGPFDCGEAVAYHPTAGSVVLTANVDVADGPFLGVWFNTPLRPWDSGAECARAAAKAIGCVVRCDPGREYPDVLSWSDVWLEVSGGTEQLVTWGQREDSQ